MFGVKRHGGDDRGERETRELPASARGRMGLRVRLLIAFVLVASMPVAALFVAQYREVEKRAFTHAEQLLEQVADVQQRRINRELERLAQHLQLVASRTQMRLSLARFNRQGTVEDLALVERILDDALSPIVDFDGLWLRDAGGVVVAGASRTKSPPAGTDIPEAPARDAIRVQIRWGSEAPPAFWLSSRLDLDGETIGSLHLLAQMGELFRILQDFPYAEINGKTLLLVSDEEGRPHVISALSPMPRPAAEGARSAVAGDPADPVRIDDELHAYRSLRFDFGELLLRVSVERATALTRSHFRWLFVDLAIILFLSLVTSLFLARMISRPIEMLKEGTVRLRSGDAGVQVPEVSWGEFAELTRSFNETSQTLAHRTAALEAEVRAHRKAQRKLANLANTDPLTGLANRRHFMQYLSRKLEQPCSGGGCGWLLYLDLDGFKPVNDENGHDIGDEVLKVVAGRLRGLVRDEDLAARIGGDEFVLLLADAGPGSDGFAVARRAEHALSMPMSIEDRTIQVRCSVGVVALETGQEARQILNEADAEMYRVKTAKRERKAILAPAAE
ncbi:MAG TPA: diguanylate cyclase [Thioalkalivibrio sp.]|nr:diguanylate cyclase [Thioalkalivibrio sp.]